MSTATLQIQIDLAGIAGRVQRLLKQVSYMASIGVRATDHISAESLRMPELCLVHDYDHTNPWSAEQAQIAWRQWILKNAFRDIAEIIAGTLEEVQHVLAVWNLLDPTCLGTQISTSKWNTEVAQRADQFHRRTLPQKLDFLSNQYEFHLAGEYVAEAMSINAARNCFVHREGQIAIIDADASGTLTMRWRQLTPYVVENGEEKELVLPYFTEKGTTLTVKAIPMERTFKPGEQLEVSLQDFSGICWTLFTFAQHCGIQLESYGRARGFKIIKKAPPVL